MNKIILLILLILLVSCFRKKENVQINTLEDAHHVYGDMTYDDLTKQELDGQWVKPKVMTFDLKKSIESPLPTLTVDSTSFISLETTDDCLIAEIKKIIFKNNLFYIWDRNNRNVFVFDDRGYFKTRIGSEGRGPKEYGELIDFAVGDNGDVFLVDNLNRKILVFSAEGVFKRSISMENDYIGVQFQKDHLVLTLSNGKEQEGKVYRVEMIDTLGSTHKYYFPFDSQRESRQLGFNNLGCRVQSDGDFLYFPQLGLQAYLIDSKGKLKKSYLFNMSEQTTPPWLAVGAKIAEVGVVGVNKIWKEYSVLSNIIDMEDYIFAELRTGLVVYALYNKSTDFYELLLHRNPNARTWPSAAFYGTQMVGATEGNVLIGYATISDMKMLQGFAPPDNFDFGKYKQQISDSEDDANPMVVLIKVKTSDEK